MEITEELTIASVVEAVWSMRRYHKTIFITICSIMSALSCKELGDIENDSLVCGSQDIFLNKDYLTKENLHCYLGVFNIVCELAFNVLRDFN